MAASRDKFSISYALWIVVPSLIWIFAHDLDRIFNLWLFLVPIVFTPLIIVAIAWLAALIVNITNHRWRRVASIIFAPFLIYVVFAGLASAGVNPQSIRFEFGKASYLRQISNVPMTDEPQFRVFDWGTTGGAAVVNVFETLIYDESDEIALPAHERSAAWRSRMLRFCPGTQMCSILQPGTSEHVIDIKKMDDHFFLVTEFYQ